MNEVEESNLRIAALNLQRELDTLEVTNNLLREAVEILQPILKVYFSGQVEKLPTALPHHNFFFGMYEDCLPAWHLNDATGFFNAIGEFDDALKAFSARV
ncbi:hypothetical protein J7E62_12535 [Variovorax paradoxus]|nr:hypothetical protein [Variovorax paradoxus]